MQVYTTNYPVTTVHVDRFGRCTPASLLRFAQDAAGEHCTHLGTDWDSMVKMNYFWAVVRQRIEITRLPEAGETVTVKTWPIPTTKVAYPRATEGFDGSGNTLFKVISVWVIVDIHSRAMVLPGKSGVTVEGICFGTELKTPGTLSVAEASHTILRTVNFSDLDVNGHMNNARYLDWLCDLLPSSFHETHPLKAATVCYMKEALEGQPLQLDFTEGDVMQVLGSVPGTDVGHGNTRIFTAQMEF